MPYEVFFHLRIKRLLKLIKRGPFYGTIVIFTNAIEFDPKRTETIGSNGAANKTGRERARKKNENENEIYKCVNDFYRCGWLFV